MHVPSKFIGVWADIMHVLTVRACKRKDDEMTRIEFDATVIPPAQVIANELGLEVEELQAWDTYDDGFNDVRTIVTQHTLFRADAPDGTTWQIDLDLATGEGVAELVTDETETASQEEVEDMVGAALAIFN